MTTHELPKILAVDDRDDNLLVVEHALAELDTTIIRANDGNAALAAALQHDLALILLDVNMPEIDGFEVATLLRGKAATRGIPIIFLTGLGNSREFVFLGYESGAVDYIQKPVDGQILRSKATVFLDLFLQRRALDEEVRQREEAVRQLEERNADLVEFAQLAAHDLKSPLVTICGFADHLSKGLLGDDLTDPSTREALQEDASYISSRSRKMSALIDKLLSYAEAGAQVTDPEDVDLNATLAQVREMLESRIQEAKATLITENLPIVSGNPTAITQLMLNLVSNAIKFYGESAPVVTVGGTLTGDRAEIAVTDQGIGIAPEYHARVFEPLQRLHGANVYEGSGLGLASCKKIVERHGGELWLDSTEGEGCTFHLTLPAAAEQGHRETAEADRAVPETVDPEGGAASDQESLEPTAGAAAGASSVSDGVSNVNVGESDVNDRLSNVNGGASNGNEGESNGNDGESNGNDSESNGNDSESNGNDGVSSVSDGVSNADAGKSFASGEVDVTGTKVLIVEDDTRLADLLRNSLIEKGVEADCVHDGQAAIDTLRESTEIELVIMDFHMPILSGYEALRAIREDLGHSDLPIVMLTARPGEQAEARLKAAGASAYMQKPVDVDKLCRLIGELAKPEIAD